MLSVVVHVRFYCNICGILGRFILCNDISVSNFLRIVSINLRVTILLVLSRPPFVLPLLCRIGLRLLLERC